MGEPSTRRNRANQHQHVVRSLRPRSPGPRIRFPSTLRHSATRAFLPSNRSVLPTFASRSGVCATAATDASRFRSRAPPFTSASPARVSHHHRCR